MPHARVGVVTVAFNSAGVLPGLLESLRESSDEISAIVIADNPSSQSDLTDEIARQGGASVVHLPRNLGYGGAVNAATANLEPVGPVLIVNPDVRIHPGAITALRAALDADPTLGAAGPKILNPDGTVYPSARSTPSLRTGVGHALFSRVWPGNPWTRRYRQDDEAPDVPRDAGWLSGACLLVRREAFDAVDGFDARYFMYFEDVDLGYRLGRAGWRNRYIPAAVATHVGGTSTATARSEMLRTHHESAYRFLAAKYRGWHLAPLRAVLLTGLRTRAWWITRRASG